MRVSNSFVIDADVVRAYDFARCFFLARGYKEQNVARPTLLVLKKRGSFQDSSSSKTDDYKISLRASFRPVGDLQLYSATLLTIRCDYDVQGPEETVTPNERAALKKEVEDLRCHLIDKISKSPTAEPSAPCSIPTSPGERRAGLEKIERPRALPGRIATGYEDLDNLLFGGIPETYAVVITSPSCDERELLLRKFIEAGAKTGQTTFYIAVELGNARALAEEYPSNFYLFVCNPRADLIIKNLPNVFKIKGVESLTDIDIAITKALRMLDASITGPRRACIGILSDVLLQHHAVITRRWLAGLLADLKSKGFTTLAVINSLMHPQEEVQAILGLFEGEIKISEKETEKGIRKILRIRKLYNQRYLEDELTLARERLESCEGEINPPRS